MKMKENNLEELPDRTLYSVIGPGALGDGVISHIILGPSHETFECFILSSNRTQ